MSKRAGFRSGTQRTIFKAALKQGWTWHVNGDTHIVITNPTTKAYVVLSATASDRGRTAANARAAARKAGLDI
jgi:hypothetical protein